MPIKTAPLTPPSYFRSHISEEIAIVKNVYLDSRRCGIRWSFETVQLEYCAAVRYGAVPGGKVDVGIKIPSESRDMISCTHRSGNEKPGPSWGM